MIGKKEIVTAIYCILLILIAYLSPVIYDSETISESIKSLYGIFAKGIAGLVFLFFVYTLIKNRNKQGYKRDGAYWVTVSGIGAFVTGVSVHAE